MGKTLLFALLGSACLLTSAAQAQSIPSSVQPGSIERQMKSAPITVPQNRISIPEPNGLEAPANAASVKIHLAKIDLVGASAIPCEELAPLYQRLIGRDATVADLYAAANAITAKYADAGYAISFAVVPQQTIDGGRAEIDVVEGYVAEYRFEGDVGQVPVALKGYVRHIISSKPLKSAVLERFLLLANDLPGLVVKSVFERMKDAPRGATRLVIHVEHRVLGGTLTVDNRGSRALGPWRADINLHMDDAFGGNGRSLTLHGLLSSKADELRYGSAEMAWPLDGNGTRLVVQGSYSESHPGIPLLSALGFGSNGVTARAGVEHTLVRTRLATLQIEAYANAQWLKSAMASATNSRDHVYNLSAGATYWRYEPVGTTTVSLHVLQGLGIFDATTVHTPMRSRQAGSGVYTTLTLSAQHVRNLGGDLEGVASVSGQLSSRGLLSSQQCGYGGSQFGRGFDDSEMVGDNCAMASLELRYAVPDFGVFDRLQLYTFGDVGFADRRGTLLAAERRSDTAYSTGLGFRWRINDYLSGWVEYAQPLSRDVAMEGTRHGRAFLAITGGF